VEAAFADLEVSGGGTINFAAGDFDLGSNWPELYNIQNIRFQGQGIDATVLRNNASATTETEPFDVSTASHVTVRNLTVQAGGPARSTSDAIDFDGGSDTLIENVKVTGSRARHRLRRQGCRGGVARQATNNVVRNCVITGEPGDGIELLASGVNRIEGCTVTDVGGHGIQLVKSSASAAQPNEKSNDNVVTGNLIDNSGQDGVNVTSGDRNQILGNSVLNSADDTSSRDGIRIGSADSISCDDNVASGNTSSDNQAVKTQRYVSTSPTPSATGPS
jgi:parallel beta-helix repeat protein